MDPTSNSEEPSLFDARCASSASATACSSGLPFFRLTSNAFGTGSGVTLCFEFCKARGLNLFGIVQEKECRCGASAGNKMVFTTRSENATEDDMNLHLRPQRSVLPPDSSVCPILAFKYTIALDGGHMPSTYLDVSDDDIEYMQKVSNGTCSVADLAASKGDLQQGEDGEKSSVRARAEKQQQILDVQCVHAHE